MRLTHRLITLAVASSLVLAGCDRSGEDPADGTAQADGSAQPETTGDTQERTPLDPERLAELLGDLPLTEGSYAQEIAVVDGMQPPTNSWIAPAVFAPEDRPVFTGVLSVRPAADTVTVGLPQPETAERVVMAPHRDELPLGLEADGYRLSERDAVSSTLEYTRGGTAVGELTLAAGWPYVQYTATTDQAVTLPEGVEAAEGGATLEVGGTTYLVRTGATVEDGAVQLAAGEHLLVTAVPEGAGAGHEEALLEGAVPLTGTSLEASADGDRARTVLSYATEGDAQTVVAALPHQELADGAEVVGTVATVLGEVRLLRGSTLDASVERTAPQTRLDLDGLSAQDRELVLERLRQDVAALDFPSPDSYHGGKEVQRAATLYELALTLEEPELAEQVKEPLVEQLDLWFDPAGCSERAERCFEYDTTLGGMLGQTPSYGSEEFNDHHFHYGHFLYAAGVLGSDDPELVERWAPVADLVAADYASPEATELFPQHRTFDAWYGHAWASGPAPFADGNNQESSSEAVNSWAAAELWGQARGDEALAEHAGWMLSQEVAATLAYWIDPELDEAFGQPSVSINWQGKRDFTTWFSAEPTAITGIQFIPMGPTHVDYLSQRPEAVAAMVEASGELSPERPLVDQVLMAQSLTDPEAARQTLEDFGPEDIDPGTSWSYLTALILSR